MLQSKALISVLLYCLARHSAAEFQDDLIEESIFTFCPKVDICDRNATSADLRPNGIVKNNRVSCCKGCSCHPDCKRNSNCCYPDDNSTSYHHEDHLVCTPMRQPDKQWNDGIPAFLTVLTAPEDGCISYQPFQTVSGQRLTPTCGSQPVAHWGDFYPVMSNKTNEIYKNEACARCHGVTDYELSRPYLVCDKTVGGNPFSDYLQVYENASLSPNCYIEFEHNDVSILRNKRCLVNPISTCMSSSLAPLASDTGLSFNMTKAACETGVFAPVVNRDTMTGFRNVFCAICSNSMRYLAHLFCEIDDAQRTSGTGKFTSMLDSTYAEPSSLLSPRKQRVTHPVACLQADNIWLEPTCRKIHCPTGMIRNDNGICVYVSTEWSTDGLCISIKLEPKGWNASLFTDDPLAIEAMKQIGPWPARWWSFSALYLKTRDGLRKNDAVFVIRLFFNGERYSVASLLNGIKRRLSMPWVAVVSGSNFEFKQSILEYDLVPFPQFRTFQPFWAFIAPKNTTHVNVDNAVLWSEIIKIRTFIRQPAYINKLLLCSQVELNDSEFDIMVDRYLIRNRLNGRWLLDMEFVLLTDITGSPVARVCLSDTPFVPRTSGCSVLSSIIAIQLSAILMYTLKVFIYE